MENKIKQSGTSSSSIGSVCSSVSSKSSRSNQNSQRNNQYDSYPVSKNEIEDAHKLYFLIKAQQEQSEIDKASHDFNQIKKDFQSLKELYDVLAMEQAFNDQRKNALKRLYFARELKSTAQTIYGLISKYGDQLDRARIRLSDDNFATIKVLHSHLKILLNKFADRGALKQDLDSCQHKWNENVPRLCVNINFMVRPKTIAKQCDYCRSEIRNLMIKINTIRNIEKEMKLEILQRELQFKNMVL